MAEQSRGGKLDGVVGCGMAFGDEVGDEFDLDGVGWHGGKGYWGLWLYIGVV